MAPCPAHALKGTMLQAVFESVLVLCFPSGDIPIPPGDGASGFPMGCSTYFASLAAIYSRNNLLRQALALSIPFTLHSDLEQVERKLLQSMEVIYPSQDLG